MSSHTQELPRVTGAVPVHHHDLPEHRHESSTLGVAIGLIWIAMAALSLGFLWTMTTFIGIERWEGYFSDPDTDAVALVLALGLVSAPIAIAAVWTTKLAKVR